MVTDQKGKKKKIRISGGPERYPVGYIQCSIQYPVVYVPLYPHFGW